MRLYYDISKLDNISEVFIDGFIFTDPIKIQNH